jgi:hypothetical protein
VSKTITRSQAKAAGLRYYFTGKPCPQGHVSKRVITGSCYECVRMSALSRYHADRKNYLKKNAVWRAKNKDRIVANGRRAKGIPTPTKPNPGKCEVPSCTRKATDADHNHTTGKFRGWICGQCNRGLGLFKDDVEHLRGAIKYLGGE